MKSTVLCRLPRTGSEALRRFQDHAVNRRGSQWSNDGAWLRLISRALLSLVLEAIKVNPSRMPESLRCTVGASWMSSGCTIPIGFSDLHYSTVLLRLQWVRSCVLVVSFVTVDLKLRRPSA